MAGAGARLAPTHIRVATEFGTAYQPPGSGSYRELTSNQARITLSGLVSGSESDDLGLRVVGANGRRDGHLGSPATVQLRPNGQKKICRHSKGG